uniref:DUF834 domain-containing protein n=1 Tax=Oryza barthii TaxID=65489 RepID=A0A0D3HE43_9ORYZ
MLTTCWCLAAVPPLLAWWSNCVGDANAAITGEAATGNGVALADGDGEAAAREERGEQVVLIPVKMTTLLHLEKETGEQQT